MNNSMSKQTLKIFQKRLVDLSARNKSLFLHKAYKGQYLDLSEANYILEGSSLDLMEKLIASDKNIALSKVLDSRGASGNEVSRKLRQISRREKYIYEESGQKNLYVGYPFVEGKLLDGTMLRAPLILFPIDLSEVSGEWIMKQRTDVPASFNTTLLMAFAHFNQIKLDEEYWEKSLEEPPKELTAFLTHLYKVLEDSPLDLNFNAESFAGRLTPFPDKGRKEVETQYGSGILKQYPQAVLGIFPQNGSHLASDYDAMEERSMELESVMPDSEAGNESMKATIEGLSAKEEELKSIFPLDAWQENAIRAVKAGGSIVVQGPPGSGKSQLICNLISDAVSKGKNVLVVCQKRVALDVVASRLMEKGLEKFAALVHDHQNDRSKLYRQIDEQIAQVENYRLENSALDSIFLERDFLRLSRDIDRISEEIDEFRDALFNDGECGISPKELYLTSDLNAPTLDFTKVYRELNLEGQQVFRRKLKNHLQYATTFLQPNYPLRNRISYARFGIGEFKQLKQLLTQVPDVFHATVRRIKAVISMEVTLEECQWIQDKREAFEDLKDLLVDSAIYQIFQSAIQFQATNTSSMENSKKLVMGLFGDSDGVEATLPSSDLILWRERVETAISQSENWYKKLIWKHLSADRKVLDTLLIANGLDGSIDSLKKLAKRMDNRLNLEHQLTKLKGFPWLLERPKDLDADAYARWFDQHLQALKAKEVFVGLRNAVKYVNAEKDSYLEFKRKLEMLQEEATSLTRQKHEWLRYLSPKQITNITNDPNWGEKLSAALEKDFDGLCAFDQMQEDLSTHEAEAIRILLTDSKDFDYDRLLDLFTNSVRIAWLEHLEAKHPVLRLVSSGRLDQLESELRQSIEARQEISHEIVKMKVKERVYGDLEFNRLKNMVTYRDLKHQVNKKRQVFPLRKLVSEFKHELFDLIPCWLASPETVSTIFPLEREFDLVIFDEASQCFAEKGLPSMARGRQVVVCGDSKQLAPLELFRPQWEENIEGELALEVQSLLDLASRYLPQHMLKGHYRSKSPELIDFSNEWFYKGELRMLPDLSATVSTTPAIEYHQVSGTWAHQTNEPEARAVANQVQLLLESGRQNMGVITFNQPQQELIMDYLDQSGVTLPDTFFVKNIENVQGDERDIILFSIGYAPDQTGKVKAHFGLLNQENGENRLNVAITRARYKIIIISSILPHQLKVEDTKSQGPKLLKKYLEYAHNVSKGQYQPSQPPAKKHAISWYLKKKIQESISQYGLRHDLPFADLAKAESQKGWLIMTDDDLYYQAMTAKNAHAYIPTHLESKGWRFKRMYSREYWRDPKEFMHGLEKFLHN